MITKLEIAGQRSMPPLLNLDDSGSEQTDPLQILDISGLGPVNASITTLPFSTMDGEAFSGGASVGKRNIVITFGLNPDWDVQTIEELRKLLYAYFMPKLQTRLVFTSSHLPQCYIDGIVESMTPNMFSKDPQVQVSIICPTPDFIAKGYTTVTGFTTDPWNLVFSDFVYNGSTPTGFHLKVTKATSDDPGEGWIGIYSRSEIFNQVFRSKGKIGAQDYFEVNTVPGKKFIRSVSTHTGRPKSYLGTLDIGTGWPLIFPGTNSFVIVTQVPGQFFNLSYFERFGGL